LVVSGFSGSKKSFPDFSRKKAKMPNGNKRHSALKFFPITQGKYQTIEINIRAAQKRLKFEAFLERATPAFRKIPFRLFKVLFACKNLRKSFLVMVFWFPYK